MKLLLTGVLPWSVWSIARRLAQGGHEVTLVGLTEDTRGGGQGIRHVKLAPGEKETTRYITAGGFDAILFFFATQCEDRREYGAVQGKQLDFMFDILHGASRTSARQFILVTDQRVFGEGQRAAENETPVSDNPTGVMIRAAESCVSCGVPDGFKTLIVRTTSLYTPEDPTSFFAAARRCAESGQELIFNGDEDTECDFVHAEDFGVFLEYAVSMELEGVVHAPQGVPSTYGETAALLKAALPDLSVSYVETRRCRKALSGTVASSVGWVPRHDFRGEIGELVTAVTPEEEAAKKKKTGRDSLLWTVLKWVEEILLAGVAVWLTRRGENNAVLASVDYMLLYVILMGFIHGRSAGVAASVLMCVWYCASFILRGGSASDLLYNTDHWLPMSVYVLSGTLFGYAQDRRRLKVDLLREEREEISRERDFMEGIYRETYEDRNQLKEQIYHSRDSYGRIYQITRELDTLQPVQVFLSTLHVLESTLQNNNVVIYEAKPESSYTRLVVRSREMRSLPRSLNLNDFPEMAETLKKGKLFANRTMKSGYPVYALPVMDEGDMLAVLMLWSVPFEQQSMYMENLLSVVAGLVQSALVRALRYHSQVGDLNFEDTHILTPEAFRQALGVYQVIRQRRMGDHVLVRLSGEREMSREMIDRYTGKLVRSTDLVGQLDDGAFYVLFPQATTDRMPAIGWEVSDTFGGILPGDAGTVLLCSPSLPDLEGEGAVTLMNWVAAGGRLGLMTTPSADGWLRIVGHKLGIQDYGGEYMAYHALSFAPGTLPVYGDTVLREDLDDYALSPHLEEDCRVLMAAGEDASVPLCWTREVGDGRVLVCNHSLIQGKDMRGLASSLLCALEDVLVYPIINAGMVFIDDFQAPQPEGFDDNLREQYGLSTQGFFRNHWWPDMKALARTFGLRCTGVLVETYNKTMKAPFVPDNEDNSLIRYYASELLQSGGELGLHGYNHQPLCLTGWQYADEDYDT